MSYETVLYVRVIILRGAGRAFCAGFAFSAPVPKFMSLWRSPKPVIAQVHGWCVGGGSDMALCADIVIAAEDAQIGTPYSGAAISRGSGSSIVWA